MALVQLPSGGSVALKDASTVTYGERKKLSMAWRRGAEADGTGNPYEGAETLVEILVDSWELPYAPGAGKPRENPDWQDVIRAPDYDALLNAVGDMQKQMYLDTTPSPDEASPTERSAGSEPA